MAQLQQFSPSIDEDPNEPSSKRVKLGELLLQRDCQFVGIRRLPELTTITSRMSCESNDVLFLTFKPPSHLPKAA